MLGLGRENPAAGEEGEPALRGRACRGRVLRIPPPPCRGAFAGGGGTGEEGVRDRRAAGLGVGMERFAPGRGW